MTRTGKLVFEETPEDWNRAFSKDALVWGANGGHGQSLAFAHAALSRLATLPEFEPLLKLHYHAPDRVASEHVSIHDYGCAAGDGTALLQAAFPGASVSGFDTASESVASASRRWPGIRFALGDVRAPREDATIIWTSHTLEHTRDAAFCVHGLLARCQVLVAIVPFIDAAGHGGHEGAEETETWLARCPAPARRASFNIVRKNPLLDEWLVEGSVLLVWQGELR